MNDFVGKRVGKLSVGIATWWIVFSVIVLPLYAKTSKLTFGSEVRFRFESQNNFNAKYYGPHPPKGDEPDNFVLGRFRLGFDYRPNKLIHLALWGQDARVWGSGFHNSDFYKPVIGMEHNPNKDELELWNTYLEIKRPFNLPFGIKAGRQQIFYGDTLIFGPGQWGNTGHWIWDAVKLSYHFPVGFVDAYYGRTMIHEPTRFSLNHRHFYESLGGYGHVTLPPALLGISLEPFSMTKRDTHRRYKGEDGRIGDLKAAYVGMRIYKKNFHGFDLDATYIREFGDFASDSIRAYGYHLLAAYTVASCQWRPRVSIEYSVGSGDHNPKDGRHETFDGAFGSRGKRYGRMNLFRWSNIRDAQINLELNPKRWMYLKAEFHKFWLDEKKDGWSLNPGLYRDKTGNSGDKVGKEFDLVCRFDLSKGHQIQAGYGHFWPDEFAKNLASNKQADWFFVQWQYKFNWKIL